MIAMHRTRRDGVGVIERFPRTELASRFERQFKRRESTVAYEGAECVGRVDKTDDGRWTYWYEDMPQVAPR